MARAVVVADVDAIDADEDAVRAVEVDIGGRAGIDFVEGNAVDLTQCIRDGDVVARFHFLRGNDGRIGAQRFGHGGDDRCRRFFLGDDGLFFRRFVVGVVDVFAFGRRFDAFRVSENGQRAGQR